jgi:hypothetical protein
MTNNSTLAEVRTTSAGGRHGSARSTGSRGILFAGCAPLAEDRSIEGKPGGYQIVCPSSNLLRPHGPIAARATESLLALAVGPGRGERRRPA